MKKDRIVFSELGAVAELSCFGDKDARREMHVLLHVEPRGELFSGQLARITAAEQALLALPQCAGMCVVAGRYFLSDATNQRPLIRRSDDAAVCYIQQPPLDGSKVAVWLYLVEEVQVVKRDALTVVQRGAYEDLWLMGLTAPDGDSAAQTETLLTRYEKMLAQQDATLADNCIRTWFHVRDVDTQYAGMVRARRENFEPDEADALHQFYGHRRTACRHEGHRATGRIRYQRACPPAATLSLRQEPSEFHH